MNTCGRDGRAPLSKLFKLPEVIALARGTVVSRLIIVVTSTGRSHAVRAAPSRRRSLGAELRNRDRMRQMRARQQNGSRASERQRCRRQFTRRLRWYGNPVVECVHAYARRACSSSPLGMACPSAVEMRARTSVLVVFSASRTGVAQELDRFLCSSTRCHGTLRSWSR